MPSRSAVEKHQICPKSDKIEGTLEHQCQPCSRTGNSTDHRSQASIEEVVGPPRPRHGGGEFGHKMLPLLPFMRNEADTN